MIPSSSGERVLDSRLAWEQLYRRLAQSKEENKIVIQANVELRRALRESQEWGQCLQQRQLELEIRLAAAQANLQAAQIREEQLSRRLEDAIGLLRPDSVARSSSSWHQDLHMTTHQSHVGEDHVLRGALASSSSRDSTLLDPVPLPQPPQSQLQTGCRAPTTRLSRPPPASALLEDATEPQNTQTTHLTIGKPTTTATTRTPRYPPRAATLQDAHSRLPNITSTPITTSANTIKDRHQNNVNKNMHVKNRTAHPQANDGTSNVEKEKEKGEEKGENTTSGAGREDKENEHQPPLLQRPRRAQALKCQSFVEPPLNNKLRQGDPFTFGDPTTSGIRSRKKGKSNTATARAQQGLIEVGPNSNTAPTSSVKASVR